jgi:uncharacterized protein YigE (DUF2233 family)
VKLTGSKDTWRSRPAWLCWLACLLALGCSPATSAPSEPARTSKAQQTPESALPNGVVWRELSHDEAVWDVFELDLTAVELRLYGQADPAQRRFEEVRARLVASGERWGPLTNAGIFHAGERPVGLFVEAGREYAPLELADGEGNFYLKPNGVFYVDGSGAHVVDSALYAPTGTVSLATQSGPLLVRDGVLHPRFLPGSSSRTTRSGIGVRDAQRAVIAVSRAPASLHATGVLFRDLLGCSNALYLDGSISDFDAPGRADASRQAFGGVLAVVERKPSG